MSFVQMPRGVRGLFLFSYNESLISPPGSYDCSFFQVNLQMLRNFCYSEESEKYCVQGVLYCTLSEELREQEFVSNMFRKVLAKFCKRHFPFGYVSYPVCELFRSTLKCAATLDKPKSGFFSHQINGCACVHARKSSQDLGFNLRKYFSHHCASLLALADDAN